MVLSLSQHFLYYPFHSHCKEYDKISILLLRSLVISKTWITLETPKDLKTVVLPSKVNCLMRHNFKMFSIFTIFSQKSLSCSRFLLYEKWTPSIFTVSLLRLTHFMPQSVTWTPFRTPIPAISHFVLLGFNPENFEKVYLTHSLILFQIFYLWERK